jgi:hypothetical protein
MYFKVEHEVFSILDGCVTHFCHITPTECPRNTTDTPVSPPVAVHIDFHGPLRYFLLVQSENTCYSTPLKTIQPSISNWLHSTLLMFNPHTTPVRLINKTLLLQNGITQPRNAHFANVLTYISRLLEALQGWTGNVYNCTHQL